MTKWQTKRSLTSCYLKRACFEPCHSPESLTRLRGAHECACNASIELHSQFTILSSLAAEPLKADNLDAHSVGLAPGRLTGKACLCSQGGVHGATFLCDARDRSAPSWQSGIRRGEGTRLQG